MLQAFEQAGKIGSSLAESIGNGETMQMERNKNSVYFSIDGNQADGYHYAIDLHIDKDLCVLDFLKMYKGETITSYFKCFRAEDDREDRDLYEWLMESTPEEMLRDAYFFLNQAGIRDGSMKEKRLLFASANIPYDTLTFEPVGMEGV